VAYKYARLKYDMKKLKKRTTMHIMLVASAVIFFWRGAWGLMDLYIFPDHELFSYITSVVFAIVILLATRRLDDELL